MLDAKIVEWNVECTTLHMKINLVVSGKGNSLNYRKKRKATLLINFHLTTQHSASHATKTEHTPSLDSDNRTRQPQLIQDSQIRHRKTTPQRK